MIALLALAHAAELSEHFFMDGLEAEPPTVKCAADGTPWCESPFRSAAICVPLKGRLVISRVSSNLPRVLSATELDPKVVHIRVDMPFPLYPRDYIAHFRREDITNGVRFWWTSVTHSKAPEREDTVRLPNAAGAWTVEQQQAGQSMVHYFWNAELGSTSPLGAASGEADPRSRGYTGSKMMQ